MPVVASHRVTTDPMFYECNSLALAGGNGGNSGCAELLPQRARTHTTTRPQTGASSGPVGSRLLAGTSKEEIVEFQVRFV